MKQAKWLNGKHPQIKRLKGAMPRFALLETFSLQFVDYNTGQSFASLTILFSV